MRLSAVEASHIPLPAFTPGSFRVDPGAVGLAIPSFVTTSLTYAFVAEFDNTAQSATTGNFVETASGVVTAFSGPGVSGLAPNSLYALFSPASGLAENIFIGGMFAGINGTYDTFNLN